MKTRVDLVVTKPDGTQFVLERCCEHDLEIAARALRQDRNRDQS